MMDGYLLVDKPAGISSFRALAQVRRILSEAAGRRVKIGHTGTLDPLATGLLILVVGSYTKRADEFSKMDKTYEVEITLGTISATGDAEGPIAHISNYRPTEHQIKNAVTFFTGKYEQTPHPHSAVKVGGHRAYKLARAGEQFKLKSREITVYSITNVEYEHPRLRFVTEVGSGTYIRSLAEDIGQKLGTGAYMSALRRTRVGKYSINDATGIGELGITKLKTLVVK